MLSAPAPDLMHAAHADAARFGAHIDLNNISEADARKLMSEEHRALGYRPPPGSLAAEAQSAASKHPEAAAPLSEEQIRLAALADAERIKSEREKNGVDLSAIGQAQASKLMSEEHKALGHRPPPGSLAAQAQAAAAQHPQGASSSQPGAHDLQRAALENASALESAASANIDLDAIGEAEARKLMSEEHKALGYRPPPGSLAAAAQAAAAKHPHTSAGIDPETIAKAALADAKKIETRRASQSLSTASSESTNNAVNLGTITVDEARALQSEEQETLGYRPPHDNLAAQAQSAVDARSDEPIAEEGVA